MYVYKYIYGSRKVSPGKKTQTLNLTLSAV